MANTTSVKSKARPYQPSWIDRFNTWVEKLPAQAWMFYVVFAFLVIGVQIFFLWLEGGQKYDELLPVIIFNGILTPFLLAVFHLLDNQAVSALNSMRPVLNTTELEFDQYGYKLSNMPFLQPLIAGLILLVIAILMERLWIVPLRYAALERLPIFTVVYHVIDKSSAFLLGVFVYHTIRQLRLVNAINSNHVRINLFHLGPLRAFSRLTASTAVVLLVGIYGWMLINPELFSDPVSLGFVLVITILAFVVFVWPLFGVHRHMEMEKERMLHEIDLHFEAAFSKFNQSFLSDDLSAIERLNGIIASLESQHKRIKAIPTWPWRPGVARFVLTAIALPLILSMLQFLILQALK